jgi:hypothetical protein
VNPEEEVLGLFLLYKGGGDGDSSSSSELLHWRSSSSKSRPGLGWLLGSKSLASWFEKLCSFKSFFALGFAPMVLKSKFE